MAIHGIPTVLVLIEDRLVVVNDQVEWAKEISLSIEVCDALVRYFVLCVSQMRLPHIAGQHHDL